MTAAEYHFVDRWRVLGTVEEVADVLDDGPDMARWWPSTYRQVRITSPGDERGVGQVGEVEARGWLPYTIRFSYRVTESHHPNGFSIEAWGDLTGRGTWTFVQDGPWVHVTYDWRVRADKEIIRRLSWLAKPIFRSNHSWTMKKGEESLDLELRRRRAAGPTETAFLAPPPAAISYVPDIPALGRPATLHVTHTAVIRRPLEEVFAYVTDPTHDLEWQPDISEVTVTSPGPIGAGSTFCEVRTTYGRKFTWEMLITAFEPNRMLAIEAVKGTVPYRGIRVFEAVEGGTRITETSEVRLGWPYRPLAAVFARMSQKPVATAYAKLATVLEGAPRPGG